MSIPFLDVRVRAKDIAWLLVAVGATLGWFGFQDLRLASAAQDAPQPLACRELAEHGPGPNAYVSLSGFAWVRGSFAVERIEGNQELGTVASSRFRPWSRAWVPLVPVEDEYARRLTAAGRTETVAPPKDFRVLVQTGHGSGIALERLMAKPVLVGTVVNVVESLDAGVERLLRQAYPGVDVERCWILELDRKPVPPKAGWLKLAAGVFVLGGGVAWLLLLHRVAVAEEEGERVREQRRRKRVQEGRRRRPPR